MILLDTHVLIWLTEGDPKLGRNARRLADDGLTNETVAVASISFWETAMLNQRGRIQLQQAMEVWRHAVTDSGIRELALTGDVAIAAAELADFHSDPADRFITATAWLNGAILITADQRMLAWSGPVQRHNALR